MNTYNDLLSDVAAWLDDSRHNALIPSWIRLAEEEHRKFIRVRAMLTEERGLTITAEDDRRSYLEPLPETYLETRRLERPVAGAEPMHSVPPENLEYGQHQVPTRYSVLGTYIEFNTVSGGYTVNHLYYTCFPALKETNQMNWLSENSYSTYLFGALLQAADFVSDDEKIQLWQSKYDKSLADLGVLEKRTKLSSGSRVSIQPGAMRTP